MHPRRFSFPITAVAALAVLAACAPPPPRATAARLPAAAAAVDPAALYCQGVGGQVIERTSGGRRADLCRLPNGRTVSAAALLNSHNDL